MLKLLQYVVLNRDIPERGLCRGDLGTIVETYEPDGFEVEFVAASGDTQAVLTLTTEDVREIGASDVLAVRSARAAD